MGRGVAQGKTKDAKISLHSLSHCADRILPAHRMPSQPILRWRVRVSENASWAIGVIPEDEIDNPMYFFTSLRVGVNSKETTRSSLLPRQNLHGLWVEIVVDVKTKHVLIR